MSAILPSASKVTPKYGAQTPQRRQCNVLGIKIKGSSSVALLMLPPCILTHTHTSNRRTTMPAGAYQRETQIAKPTSSNATDDIRRNILSLLDKNSSTQSGTDFVSAWISHVPPRRICLENIFKSSNFKGPHPREDQDALSSDLFCQTFLASVAQPWK